MTILLKPIFSITLYPHGNGRGQEFSMLITDAVVPDFRLRAALSLKKQRPELLEYRQRIEEQKYLR